MRIIVDQETCIGAASCVAIAAQTFGLNQEGKVFILNENLEKAIRNESGECIESVSTDMMDIRETLLEGARSCPVQAIRVFEDSGEEIIL
ncbi:ferredoxin [Candidatus Uhrbacteria bacterium]|nr:ferredoxin [Candidatus Uhrbacteria bacterium]